MLITVQDQWKQLNLSRINQLMASELLMLDFG